MNSASSVYDIISGSVKLNKLKWSDSNESGIEVSSLLQQPSLFLPLSIFVAIG